MVNLGTNAQDIRDIRGPVDIPNPWLWVLWILVGLALAALAAWLAHRWLRRRKAGLPPVPPVPPHVRARRLLDEALASLAQPNLFCTRVSQTIRVYLEERFDLHAPERTTEEFLDELQSSPVLARNQKQFLGDFLTRCDLVKFARHEPAEPELRDLWGSARRLVDETAPPESVPQAEPGPPADAVPASSSPHQAPARE